MQTFLPYPVFSESVKCLDTKRLGKQRVECLQILTALEEGTGWVHHPATKMWRGHENTLRYYLSFCIREWTLRGFRNTIPMPDVRDVTRPPWLGDKAFHDSHKSNLLRKAPFWYGKFNWNVPDDLPYVWPV